MNIGLLIILIAWAVGFLMLAGYVILDELENGKRCVAGCQFWRDLGYCVIWPGFVLIFILLRVTGRKL